jgi:DNA-binding MarR family transcriptional regulator
VSNSNNVPTSWENIRETEVATKLVRKTKNRRLDRFLKGPIPIKEIATAARLPGKALALLLAIHHRIDLTGKAIITLPSGLLAELGISRDGKARGLNKLEQAGLIRVTRSSGRAAQIELQPTQKEIM